jgi:hypothetical protein
VANQIGINAFFMSITSQVLLATKQTHLKWVLYKSPTVHRNLGLQRTVSFLIPLGGSVGGQKYL